MAAIDDETVPLSARYPPYVRTEAEKERWDIVTKVAERYVELYEGHPDPRFVWYATRQWYFSDIPTGSPDDPPSIPVPEPTTGSAASPLEPTITEAELDSKDKQAGPRDKAEEMFAELQAKRPAPGSPREDFIEGLGRVADLLDELFGDPDDYDFGEHEVKPLEEAIAGMIHGAPYKELLHPRDRLGKWSQKLGGLHNFVAKNRDGMKQALAVHVAAARIKLTRKTGVAKPTPQQLADAHRALMSGKADRDHFLALASEQRQRQGLRGAARKVERQTADTKATGMIKIVNALAYIGSEEAEKKHPLTVPAARNAEEMNEFRDRTETTYEQAHRLAEFAMEHRDEIGSLLRAGAWHYAKSTGLVHAEIEDDAEASMVESVDLDVADDVLLTLGYE